MIKTVFAALSFASAAAPGFSAEMMACSEENVMKVEQGAMTMTDKTPYGQVRRQDRRLLHALASCDNKIHSVMKFSRHNFDLTVVLTMQYINPAIIPAKMTLIRKKGN